MIVSFVVLLVLAMVLFVLKNRKTTRRVEEIYLYPVKSCRGIKLQSANLTKFGIMFDRQWVVLDHEGKFCSLRNHPKMAQIIPSFERDNLVLNTEGLPPLRLPLNLDSYCEEVLVSIWGNETTGLDAGSEASEWISSFLNRNGRDRTYKIVVNSAPKTSSRDPQRWEEDYEDEYAKFSDDAPYLFTNIESLKDLNSNIEGKLTVPMNRFRANIVVSGFKPWEEDNWDTISINGLQFRFLKKCGRCSVPTKDHLTGKATPGYEPTSTLMKIRCPEEDDPFYSSDNPLFGSYFAVQGSGPIAVGDTVEILSTK
eukprot:TRINITY_DN2038_c0_g1_i2.p1 TRINITY_DN2038_c0_g1~~TRINITY_DN2038_c0_g1_i2.p1  ORF type:complete len:311 (-),score=54.13 TRINITY_DN2038_c0_g1_i2:209-1141(-)